MTENGKSAIDRRSAEQVAVDVAIRLGLLGLFSYWALTVVAPFLTIAIWAVILAVAIYPVHQWLAAHLGGRENLASVLITALGLVIIFGPAAALAVSLFESVQPISAALKSGSLSIPAPPASIAEWPVIGEILHRGWNLAATNLEQLVRDHSDFFLSTGGSLLGRLAGAAGSILSIGVSVVMAGFLYGNGASLISALRTLARRIVAERGETFVELTGATIRNVSRGVIGISMLQSILAGIGFLLAGVPAAGLITTGVLVLGVVQIGPTVLILPAIIWSWTTFDWTIAAAFTAYMLPVMLIDNVLKPIVMARGLRTPMPVILLGVLGGTLTHGLIGLFLGPIVLAVFYELFSAWVTTGMPDPQDQAPK